MKHVLFYVAAAAALVAAAVLFRAKFFSVKEQAPPYVWGKGRGMGVDFMDTAKAQGGVTPIKGNLEVISAKPDFGGNSWFGKVLAVKSSMPTINPVQVQTKTIWGKAGTLGTEQTAIRRKL